MSNELEAYLKSAFERVLRQPPHSLVLASPNQTSLDMAIAWLATELAGRRSEITDIVPDGASIKIEQIRPLYRLAHQRRDKTGRRVITMAKAGLMSMPAQNAILKLLEEPPAGVIFLLGTTEQALLAPTIRSRSRIEELPPVALAEYEQLFPADTEQERERRYRLSQGDPLLASRLDELSATVEQAKRLLSLPLPELTGEVSKLNPSREQVAAWCQGLVLICQAALIAAKNRTELKAWLGRSEAVITAQRYLQANASHKLTLKWLLLEIRQ